MKPLLTYHWIILLASKEVDIHYDIIKNIIRAYKMVRKAGKTCLFFFFLSLVLDQNFGNKIYLTRKIIPFMKESNEVEIRKIKIPFYLQ
jgi:hypothetical protein